MSEEPAHNAVEGNVRRVVLDTNIVLSALLFSAGRLARLRPSWQGREFVPLVNTETVHELLRALGYRKSGLQPKEREELLADFLPYAEVVSSARSSPAVPDCRDPSDRMFLVLAATGRADALVTGDRDLLALDGQVRFPILTADSFLRLLGDPRAR